MFHRMSACWIADRLWQPRKMVVKHSTFQKRRNIYGPTETTIWSTAEKLSLSDDIVTIGRPIANTEIYILDAEVRPQITGEIGESHASILANCDEAGIVFCYPRSATYQLCGTPSTNYQRGSRVKPGLNVLTTIGFILIALLVGESATHAQTKADEVAVRDVPQAFAAAWAKHDGHQLARIMSEDVDFVNVGGDWLHGRPDFELYHTRLLSGRFKESTLTPLETAVRFLRPDLAVLHWSWSIQGDRNEDLTLRKPRFGLFTMIVEKRGKDWLVVEAQNTNQMTGPNPELDGIKPPICFP
jgi:uncharacterized protein (TIGR02246 family)